MAEHVHHAMDRQIFNQDLSVEAKSAYILIASTVGDNVWPSMDLIRSRWNSTPENLDAALEELTRRGIIQLRPGPDGKAYYYPQPSSLWR